MSQQGIADRLNQRGIPSPAAYKKSCGSNYRAKFQTKKVMLWSAVAVTRILTNECYTRTLIQGKTITPNYKVKKTVVKQEEEWVRIGDAFESIISREDFETVQTLLGMDTRVAPDKSEVYLFSGIAVCGDCGRQMSRKVSTVAGKKYVYYMCSANKREGKCTSHRIREAELEAAVMECLNFRLEKLTELKGILDHIGTMPIQAGDVKRLEVRIIQLEEEAEKYEGLKVSVYEDLKEGLVDKEEYLSIKQEFDSRRKAALVSIEQLKQEIGRLAKRDGRRHEWIESFVKHRGIRSLVRSVVVELIEVKFRYEDRYLEMLDMAENAGQNLSMEAEREVS